MTDLRRLWIQAEYRDAKGELVETYYASFDGEITVEMEPVEIMWPDETVCRYKSHNTVVVTLVSIDDIPQHMRQP